MVFDAAANQVMRVKLMKRRKGRGQKWFSSIRPGLEQDHMSFVTKAVYTENNLDFLKQIAKALITEESGKLEGYRKFAASLKGVKVSEDAEEIAALYGGAKKAMIVFQQNVVSVSCAETAGRSGGALRTYRKSP